MNFFYHTLKRLGYTHPVHPTLVYLPIGCIMAAFFFGTTAILFKRTSFSTTAKHCITLALLAVFPTVALGYMDWQHFLGGAPIFPIRMKMILAGALLLFLPITVWYNWKFSANKKTILAFYAVCFLNVVAIGYFGGETVFAGFAPKISHPETATTKKIRQPTATITYADVSEILQQQCIRCHRGPEAAGGLQLDTYAHTMQGGSDGQVIVPGKPGASALVRRIEGLSKPVMPYGMKPLPQNSIDLFSRWIQQGAKAGDTPQQKK